MIVACQDYISKEISAFKVLLPRVLMSIHTIIEENECIIV